VDAGKSDNRNRQIQLRRQLIDSAQRSPAKVEGTGGLRRPSREHHPHAQLGELYDPFEYRLSIGKWCELEIINICNFVRAPVWSRNLEANRVDLVVAIAQLPCRTRSEYPTLVQKCRFWKEDYSEISRRRPTLSRARPSRMSWSAHEELFFADIVNRPALYCDALSGGPHASTVDS
jgi:hypothetical protein